MTRCRFGRRRLLLVAYVSTLVLGLASAASISYTMFAITRTLTGTALAGFTIIVMPLGETGKGWTGPIGLEGGVAKDATEPIWLPLTVFLSGPFPGPRAGVAGRGAPHCGRRPEQHLLDRGHDAAGTNWVPDQRLAMASAGCHPSLRPRHC